MQASNTSPALMLFVRLTQLMLLSFSASLAPPNKTLQNTRDICCSAVAHGQKAPPFIGFSPPRIFNWSLQSPGLNTENSHLTQIYVLNSQIIQPGLSKRDQNVRILLNKERSQWSCFLLHHFHLWSEVKEVAGSRELEALGHTEISFPESQPVLSALLLLSVVITCWAALHFKCCT